MIRYGAAERIADPLVINAVTDTWVAMGHVSNMQAITKAA